VSIHKIKQKLSNNHPKSSLNFYIIINRDYIMNRMLIHLFYSPFWMAVDDPADYDRSKTTWELLWRHHICVWGLPVILALWTWILMHGYYISERKSSLIVSSSSSFIS
jgi:hypothetical protein